MAFVGDLAKDTLGLIPRLLIGKPKPKEAAPAPITPPVPTRNMAAESARRSDRLRRRRGAAGNEYAGAAAPATPAVKTLLGQ